MPTIYLFSDKYAIPVYVGKAKNFDKRIKQHLERDRFKYDTWFYRWLNKQITLELPFYFEPLEECLQEDWQKREKYWIAHIKENGYQLCNMTDGGDGNNNQIFSDQTKKKMSEAQKGHKHTEETKRKISQGHIGKIISNETKEKIRQVNLGKKYSEERKLVNAKKVIQYDLDENFIEEYPSLTQAANFLKCRKSSLSNAIERNKKGRFKGFIWKYK